MLERWRALWLASHLSAGELLAHDEFGGLRRTTRVWWNGRPVAGAAELTPALGSVRMFAQLRCAPELETLEADFPDHEYVADLGMFALDGFRCDGATLRLRKRIDWWRLRVRLVAPHGLVRRLAALPCGLAGMRDEGEPAQPGAQLPARAQRAGGRRARAVPAEPQPPVAGRRAEDPRGVPNAQPGRWMTTARVLCGIRAFRSTSGVGET